ncbi:MAG: response regulator [Acetobacteraceae bacterium]
MSRRTWPASAIRRVISRVIGFSVTTPLIAIVDDDESVCIGLTSLVRSLGYEAQSFGSAEDFLGWAGRDGTACLISDVQMPGLGGLDLQKALVAEGRQVPIIFITAYPDPHVQQLATQAGALCFLSKPFDGDALIKCLGTALGTDGAP